jgi:hypothetical protein
MIHTRIIGHYAFLQPAKKIHLETLYQTFRITRARIYLFKQHETIPADMSFFPDFSEPIGAPRKMN